MIQRSDKIPVFQALIAKELEAQNANAVWIDTGNESSTYALNKYGSEKLMEKVSIGRAFTPFQHHSLVQQLEDFIDRETEILILPNVTGLYLDGQVKSWEAEELFRESWTKIMKLQKEYNLKILVSLPQNSNLDFLVKGDIRNKINVEQTSQGLKYASSDFETSAYSGKGFYQTTIPYWNRKNPSKVKIKAVEVF